MKATVREIAKLAGVSTASVSMVLNDKPSRITEETKLKIREAAQELGYVQRQRAAKPVAAKSEHKLIGVIRPHFYDEFVDSCLQGIGDYASVHGYEMLIASADGNTDHGLECLEMFCQAKVGGVIMIPPIDMNEGDHNILLGKKLQNMGMPFVLLDQAIYQLFCDFVTTDNKSGGYMATEHLLQNGHTNIGIIAGKLGTYTTRKRVEGYKEALTFYDIVVDERKIHYGTFNEATGYEGAECFQKMGIHALIACDDKTALGVYRYAAEHGLTIGDNLSIVGFNDFAAAPVLSPPLTCVCQSGASMGKKACETIIKRLNSEADDEIRTMYFAPQLLTRKSVKNLIS